MFEEKPHPLTLTEGWDDLSPHEKKEKMQASIREELAQEIAEEQATEERLAILRQENVDKYISALENDAVVAQSVEHLPCKQGVEGSIPSDSTNALVAQGSEQGAHNALVAGSIPAEGTNLEFLPPGEIQFIPDSIYREKAEIYEGVLRAIASITKVETPADRGAEAFFFIASKMRKMAIAALQKTGAWR